MISYSKSLVAKVVGVLEPVSRTQLSAGLVVPVRAFWLFYLVLILLYMIAGLPLVLAQNQASCVGMGCLDWQLSAEGIQRLVQSGITLTFYGWYSTILPLIVPLLSLVLATIVLWKRPNDRMAWLFALALGTCPVNLSMSTIALANVHPVMLFPAKLIEFGLASLILFIALFPTGCFVPRWIGWFIILNTLIIGTAIFFPITQVPGTITALLFQTWQPVSAMVLFGMLFYRYWWVADTKQRQQLKLLVFGLLVPVLVNAFFSILLNLTDFDLRQGSLGFLVQRTFTIVGIAFFIIALWVAVFRYQMFDIDLIIKRTLVYTVLTVLVIGLYILIVSLLGILLQTSENFLVSLIATGAIAVLFQPLRVWLQRGINQLLYGKRNEPYQVLVQLGSRLAAIQATEAILPAIIETARDTLHLPYVAIRLDRNTISDEKQVSAGILAEITTDIRLYYQGNQVGALIASPRSGESELSPTDLSLLSDFARQAEIAIHAVSLAQALQRSREEIVTAREEERRRLRRDLHDGLGPSLATISIQSETARGLLRDRPEAAEALLDELTNQAQTTMQEVRRLIHALRPPVLDDLGLIPGLNALAASFSQSGVSISIQSASHLPEMPAAYEVAIYRIVQEALTNVVKHARATICTVRLVYDQGICLDIEDNGIGISQNRTSGIGINSMRERAEELSGTYTSAVSAVHGTHIQVRLPTRSSHGPH
jgi:signal transduction histidine kinase